MLTLLNVGLDPGGVVGEGGLQLANNFQLPTFVPLLLYLQYYVKERWVG